MSKGRSYCNQTQKFRSVVPKLFSYEELVQNGKIECLVIAKHKTGKFRARFRNNSVDKQVSFTTENFNAQVTALTQAALSVLKFEEREFRAADLRKVIVNMISQAGIN